MKISFRIALLAATSLALPVAGYAQSMTDVSKGDDAAEPTITVTAEKLDRSVQDTATSVVVTTQKDIERLNIIDLEDVLRRVGNAGFVDAGSGQGQQFTIRGVQSQGVTAGSSTPVSALFIDGAIVPNQAAGAAITNAWDVAQIEVLRGAQSTVQGRNSLIGAIAVTTNNPTDRFEYAFQGRYGEYDTFDISGMLSGPIIGDDVKLRVAAQHAESDGFVTFSDGTKADRQRSTVVRGKLLIEPSAIPQFTAQLTAIYSDERDGNALQPESQLQQPNIVGRIDRELQLYSLQLNYEFSDKFSLQTLSTYSKLETGELADFDGLAAFPFQFTPTRTNTRDQDDMIQELRLTFKSDRVRGFVGGLYAERGADDFTRAITVVPTAVVDLDLAPVGLNQIYRAVIAGATGGGIANFATPATAPRRLADPLFFGPSITIESDFNFQPEFQTKALFGEVEWDITDRLTLALAARYEWERADFRVTQVNSFIEADDQAALTTGAAGLVPAIRAAVQADLTPLVGPGTAAALAAGTAPVIASNYPLVARGVVAQLTGPNFLNPSDLQARENFNAFLPKAVLRYAFSDQTSLAFSVQRAYRPGGVGVNPVRARTYSFDPEFSTNYEAALRHQTADGRFTFNANIFYIDWSEQQLEVALSGTPQDTEVVNAASSRLYGAEAQIDVRVTDALTLFGTIGLLDTKIRKDNGQGFAGDEFPFAPDMTLTLGANLDLPSGFNATVDMNYQSASQSLLPNNQTQSVLLPNFTRLTREARQNDERVLFNARIGYDFNDRLSVFAYGSNIFNETYRLNGEALGGNAILGDPRVLGVGIRIRN
jgi:outer membrane receptor protein involved in Fe transport